MQEKDEEPNSGIDSEGDTFWKRHFGCGFISYLFPLLYDAVSEDYRNREVAVLSLLSLLLYFLYSTVFNVPGSTIYCTQTPDTFWSPIETGGFLFEIIYLWLWLAAMVGNVRKYSHRLYHFGTMWTLWVWGCFAYEMANCDLKAGAETLSSIAFYVYLIYSGTHYICGYYWLLYYLPSPFQAYCSPFHWVSLLFQRMFPGPFFQTPIRMQMAIALSLCSTSTLFVQVNCTQSLQQILLLFQAIDSLSSDSLISAEILRPLPYALIFGTVLSFVAGLFSMFSLYFNYRKTVLRIVMEGRESELLREVWKVPSYNAMFFTCMVHLVQFMAHSIYLYTLLTYILTSVFFLLFSPWFYHKIFDFLLSHPMWLPLLLIGTGVKMLYLPRLIVKSTNEIRNHTYFAFWDLVQTVLGVSLGLVKGLIRFLIGIGLMLGFAYRSHKSVYSPRFAHLDALYSSYCGMVVVHCLSLGIEPRDIENRTNDATGPSSRQTSQELD